MKISSIFSNGMILQRGKVNTIRGAFTEGEIVNMSMDGNDLPVNMDLSNGLWTCEIPSQTAGGPHTLVVSSGLERIEIVDVLFGDVYILGGQSNMELPVIWTTDYYYDEIISADFPEIRQFEVPKVPVFGRKNDLLEGGRWAKCDQQDIWNFSAIGFYFAKYKYLQDGVPVGLVQTAVGGAPVESLMSEENMVASFESFAEKMLNTGKCNQDKSKGCLWCYQEKLKQNHDSDFVETTMKSDLDRQNAWHQDVDDHDLGLQNHWTDKWTESESDLSYKMPSTFYQTDMEDFKGCLWLQKTVDIPASWCDQRVELRLGTLMDGDQTFVNGEKVGEYTFKYPPRRYFMEPGILHDGENTITIRLKVDGNIGGAVEKCPYYLKLGEEQISIEGEWKMRIGYQTERLESPTFFNWAPTALFGSMLYPIRDYACKAILFYQGESNCEYPQYYGKLLKDMVKEWRDLYGDVPFYMAEVTYWLGDGPVYESDPFVAVREVQHDVVHEIPNAYLIPTYDLGMYNDLHPQNKKDVAMRFLDEYMKNEKNESI